MSQPGRLLFRAAIAASVMAALAAGCGDSSTTVSVPLNLDRPSDVAFTCYGGLRRTGGGTGPGTADQAVIVSAQPVSSCDAHTKPRLDTDPGPEPTPPGQEDLTEATPAGAALQPVSYYGLILQSGPGTVVVAQFSAKRSALFSGNDIAIRDSDPLTPGKTSISVGVRPVAIATDPAGCFAVTANAGSCDLSTLDLNSAFTFDGSAQVSRMRVHNSLGDIDARPAAMVAAPGLPVTEIGNVCPATATGLAYVAYPACHLVAAVDLATGAVMGGIQVDAAGVPSIVDGNVSCPQECSMSAPGTAGWRPVTLDLVDDPRTQASTRRMVIGADNSNSLILVELDPATTMPIAVSQVDLEESALHPLGVLDVAMSPQIGMGNDTERETDPEMKTETETAPGGQFQFVYAVTTDGTVRVADVLNQMRECDTQLDPRFLTGLNTDADVATLSCLPIGDPTKPRRAGATGPGLTVPNDGVAAAVTILRVDEPKSTEEVAAGPNRLVGYFGVVSSTTGATYIVDIDDENKPDHPVEMAPLAFDLGTALPHQLRDQVAQREAVADPLNPETVECGSSGPGVDAGGTAAGGTRLVGPINRLTLPEVVAINKVGILPNFLQLPCYETAEDQSAGIPKAVPISELSFPVSADNRVKAFPDTRSLRSTEDWRLVWEGTLSGDAINQDNNGPVIRIGTVVAEVAGQLTIKDGSKPYCAAGVLANDLVQLRGCDATSNTNQCPLGQQCFVHPDAPSGLGTCLPEKTGTSLLDACRDFMLSVRRYTVGTSTPGALTLLPRKRVLRSTPLTGCESPTQCQTLADYEAKLATDLHPFEDTTASTRTYTCEADAARGPLNRCVMTCTKDADCSSGSSCDEVAGRCMEGVVPPAECVAGQQRYDLRAADAFTVIGSISGYLHSVINDAGTCKVDPAANPLLTGRVPLSAPPCVGTAPDQLTPNPCSEDVMQVETVPNYVPGTCTLADPETATRTRAAKSIYFRNPSFSFHLVDPTYPGDAVCRNDAAGSLVDVPNTFTGYAMTFRQTGGYAPLSLRTNAVLPVQVVRGPQQSIWVVDEGDYLSETPGLPSTRGKVFRIEGASLSIVNTMQ